MHGFPWEGKNGGGVWEDVGVRGWWEDGNRRDVVEWVEGQNGGGK